MAACVKVLVWLLMGTAGAGHCQTVQAAKQLHSTGGSGAPVQLLLGTAAAGSRQRLEATYQDLPAALACFLPPCSQACFGHWAPHPPSSW